MFPQKGEIFSRRNPVDRPVVPGKPGGLSTPIFFLASQKENGGGAVKRKNTFRCAVTGAPRPPGQRDAALNGPAQLMVTPTRTRAGLSADFRTQYAVLHSEVIGQRPNLTSDSFRAFRFAKRYTGS